MKLMDLLLIVNDGQTIEIVSNDTGEVLFPEIECSEFIGTVEYWDDPAWEATVMDVNCYNSVLTICIEEV